jgi:hypothetical protein
MCHFIFDKFLSLFWVGSRREYEAPSPVSLMTHAPAFTRQDALPVGAVSSAASHRAQEVGVDLNDLLHRL